MDKAIESRNWFTNYYRCERCGEQWEDEWDCMCDDECPACSLDMTPFASDDEIDRKRIDHTKWPDAKWIPLGNDEVRRDPLYFLMPI